MFSLLNELQFPNSLLAEAAAFAAIATLGYLFGKRTRHVNSSTEEKPEGSLHTELNRAKQIAGGLQDVTLNIRKELAGHHAKIAEFQKHVRQIQEEDNEDAWKTLSEKAEAILGPTLRLTTNLSLAYDQLRKQSAQLMTFAGSRIDAETGVHNRRALQEQLEVLFSMNSSQEDNHERRFALALFSIEVGDDPQDAVAFAQRLAKDVRGTDFVARYSTDEFAVVMPQTHLGGALVFSQRFLAKMSDECGTTVWGGVVETSSGDDPNRLLSRADSALYSARATGQSCLFQHVAGMLRRAETNTTPVASPSTEYDESHVSVGTLVE
ncbi:GGDEF domain-containing protein [Adhaeretor mobilis]|uniref:diguanylate cyclase n=1 Tax=Adhaeretor mobilis TaxID=1930276 RepID=A0A517MXW0_9BACT|nr:GGDEF domain-containing protein [Adhaeretor mobilis]QDS99714.1 Response regulator PleD [Adhaeretor mobilis]